MSATQTVEARIKELIGHVLDQKVQPSDISDTDCLFGGMLGFDSVAMLELIAGLEQAFGFEVSEEDINVKLFENVHTLAEYVKHHLHDASM